MRHQNINCAFQAIPYGKACNNPFTLTFFPTKHAFVVDIKWENQKPYIEEHTTEWPK